VCVYVSVSVCTYFVIRLCVRVCTHVCVCMFRCICIRCVVTCMCLCLCFSVSTLLCKYPSHNHSMRHVYTQGSRMYTQIALYTLTRALYTLNRALYTLRRARYTLLLARYKSEIALPPTAFARCAVHHVKIEPYGTFWGSLPLSELHFEFAGYILDSRATFGIVIALCSGLCIVSIMPHPSWDCGHDHTVLFITSKKSPTHSQQHLKSLKKPHNAP